MGRFHFAVLLLLSLLGAGSARALDETPPISITSPDEATTYALATLKQHSLFWNTKSHQLFARLVFSQLDQDGGSASDDAHDFYLPGVTLDAAKKIFYASSATGEMIPVARLRKTLFLVTVETLPNSVVRVLRSHGDVNVVLEAIRPDDPALRAPPPNTDVDSSTPLDIHKILN